MRRFGYNHVTQVEYFTLPLVSHLDLGGMVGMVGIWMECHFSENPPKFHLDSNPIPTKFPPFTQICVDQIPTAILADSMYIC